MAGIPESEIAAARLVRVEDVWVRLGLPDLGRNGLVCSPFREDKSPSLQVGHGRNIAHDFATNETFDTIDVVRRALGFHAIGLPAGEKSPGAQWAAYLADQGLPVVVCFDHDDAGRTATVKACQALADAGIPADLIRFVSWPEDSPAGFDLTDALKAWGVEDLRRFLRAPEYWNPEPGDGDHDGRPTPSEPDFETDLDGDQLEGDAESGPVALNLGALLAVERATLRDLIGIGILPEWGKLLLSATAKLGKTFWGFNCGLCMAAGNCTWLGMTFGKPVVVLVIQPELSDGLTAYRFHWVLRTAPDWLDKRRAMQNFHVWPNDAGRPVLRGEQLLRVEAEIARVKPDVVLCDPLYALFPGLVENAAEEMTLALDLLTTWTVRFGCAVILIHHHGKSGQSRGSSVLQGWPETDLSMSAVPDEENVVKVEGLFRCSFGAGWPAYWRRPDEESGWFREVEPGWEPPSAGRGRKPGVTVEIVRLVLKEAGQPLSHTNLKKAVMDAVDCSESTAIRRINDAVEAGQIGHGNGAYYVR